jgi:hypothetical protein
MPTVDIDNRDPGGSDEVALVNRVNACLNTLQAVNQRMIDIQISWGNPGPPGGPDALNALIAECKRTMDIAVALGGTRV